MSRQARVFDSVAQARAAAGASVRDDASVNLFQTWAWFLNLDERGKPEEFKTACVLLTEEDGAGRLCLPFAAASDSPAAMFGSAMGSLANYYSSLFGPIGAAAHCGVDDCRLALKALRRLGRAADVMNLQPLDGDSGFFRAMLQALKEEGYIVDRYFCFGNWHLPCQGVGFAAYFAGLPSRVRNTVNRHRKKLDKQGAWSMDVLTENGEALELAIAQFTQVYGRSWKVPEPFPDFVPGLCRAAAREGWLRLGVLRVGDAPAAAQLWLVREGKAMIYKLAYDEAFSQYSPGSVLSAEMFRRMLDEERVVDVDYLTGDDGYKRDWMSHRRERVGLVAFRRSSVRGLFSAGRHYVGRWRRSVRSPAPDAPAPALADA